MRIYEQNIRKRTFGHVYTAKIQINLRLRASWPEYSLGTFWTAKNDMEESMFSVCVYMCLKL